MNIKLVICDIDGTITNDKKELSEKTIDVINKIHQHGFLFGIASGRPVDELMTAIKKWGIDFIPDVVIGMNGSELFDTKSNKQFDYFKLKKEWIKEIIDDFKIFKSNPLIYKDGGLLCSYVDELVIRSTKHSGKKIMVANDISDYYKEDNAKIMFRVENDLMPTIEEYFKNRPNENYIGFRTQVSMYEFCDKRVNKGYALKEYCKLNNIDINEVVAFGDTTNDNEMLKEAGLGICLLNGSDDTKEIADIVTSKTSSEDGFAWYIEENLGLFKD